VEHLENNLPPSYYLHSDLPGKKNPADLFYNILPDITVVHGDQAYILALTCCYEKNFIVRFRNKVLWLSLARRKTYPSMCTLWKSAA